MTGDELAEMNPPLLMRSRGGYGAKNTDRAGVNPGAKHYLRHCTLLHVKWRKITSVLSSVLVLFPLWGSASEVETYI